MSFYRSDYLDELRDFQGALSAERGSDAGVAATLCQYYPDIYRDLDAESVTPQQRQIAAMIESAGPKGEFAATLLQEVGRTDVRSVTSIARTTFNFLKAMVLSDTVQEDIREIEEESDTPGPSRTAGNFFKAVQANALRGRVALDELERRGY